jgi:hypothetical protein
MNTPETQSGGSLEPVGSPATEDFETCLRVLRWLSNIMWECNPTYVAPITEISGVVRGCKAISEGQKPKPENH